MNHPDVEMLTEAIYWFREDVQANKIRDIVVTA